MKIVRIKSSRLDLQKDGDYRYAYRDREVLSESMRKEKARKESAERKQDSKPGRDSDAA